MIARCPELEPKWYDALRESFGSDAREGIHLSALLSPRQEFWKHVDPRPLTDDELGYFTAGRGHEDALVRFLGADFKITESTEIDGIHLRPDFEAVSDRIVPRGAHVEFKTRRSNLPVNDDEAQTDFSNYRAQVRGYMALKRMNEMYLVVFSLTEGKTGDPLSRSHPVFAIYRETATDAELEQEREKLQARRRGLLDALAVSSADAPLPFNTNRLEFLTLPLCEAWMCGKRRPEMTTPPVCQTCGQVFKSAEFGPEKHVQSAKGKGHIVTPAEIVWHYEPRCKWYGVCRPQDVDKERGAA